MSGCAGGHGRAGRCGADGDRGLARSHGRGTAAGRRDSTLGSCRTALVPRARAASARPVSTAAAMMSAAAAAAAWVRRSRHRSLGGSSGLGKPWCPNVAACCATAARWATASGVLLLASLSTSARSPCGMAAMGSAVSGARPSRSAGASSRRLRSVHSGHRSMCRLIRLRIRTFSCPSQSSSSAPSASQSARPERATSSAPSEISSWSRARESSACAWLRETPSTAAISVTSSSCRNCSSIRSCSPALRPRTAERSSARNSARSAPPVTSADSSLISGRRSSAEVPARALSRKRRWHSLRATAYSHGRSRLGSRSAANLDAAMTKVSCTASAASAGSCSRERQ